MSSKMAISNNNVGDDDDMKPGTVDIFCVNFDVVSKARRRFVADVSSLLTRVLKLR